MRIFFFCFLLLGAAESFAQQKALNIPGLYQLVDASKSEYNLQNDAKNKQAIASAQEYENKTLLAKLKGKYRDLQQRYNTIGILVSAINIGINATPMVNHIVQDQSAILQLATENPVYIALATQTEIEFAAKALSLADYLIGLTASLGALNQMKMSDRLILFDYVLSELSAIQSVSSNLLNELQLIKANGIFRTLNPFQSFIDQDKSMVKDIVNNAKYLKR